MVCLTLNTSTRLSRHAVASPTNSSTTPGSPSRPTTNRSKLSRLTEISGVSHASFQIGQDVALAVLAMTSRPIVIARLGSPPACRAASG